MTEEWKIIEDYPNYSVSNLGRVRNNKTRKILKPGKTAGYLRVNLSKGHCENKGIQVHRLVAKAFIPNPDNKPEVNHIDGNKDNNVIKNLEWVTRSENITHSYRVLNKDNGHSKKIIRVEDGRIFNSVKEATLFCGLKRFNDISDCLRGKRHTAAGYHWLYYESDLDMGNLMQIYNELHPKVPRKPISSKNVSLARRTRDLIAYRNKKLAEITG